MNQLAQAGSTQCYNTLLILLLFTLAGCIPLFGTGGASPTPTAPASTPGLAAPPRPEINSTLTPPSLTPTPLVLATVTPMMPKRILPTPLPITPKPFNPARRIIFVREQDGNQDIYTIQVDGTNLQRLTDYPGYDRSPTWAPDGQRIAFMSEREGNGDIFVMNVDGSNVVNLTNHPARDGFLRWSPDGTKIGFLSYRNHELEVVGAMLCYAFRWNRCCSIHNSLSLAIPM